MALHDAEYVAVKKVIDEHLERGAPGIPPQFILMCGGVGAGKTTIRREKYSDGFVHFDFGEMFVALKKSFPADEERATDLAMLASDILFKVSLERKLNLVVELIGDDKDQVSSILDGMLRLGYEARVEYVYADPAEACQRHLMAVKDDPDYLSAYFTQEYTLAVMHLHLSNH